ncbi:DUF6386 family protein [Paenibacillus arenosi]|uniref:Integron gene cassette protein n=1 Tax=Paenibacillus arenosi TaxID=2774142 RepID=A0ABR9B2K6_9BACL|nr:DUF6386 family protein [Paenibacillus arenosi]MBD8499685.1 hypothetical protein [Paenibacillus arenosi]
MQTARFSFSTDTATLAVFDLEAIKHRINDSADWWSIPEDELDEINQGNIIFLGLGSDGAYSVDILDSMSDCDGSLYMKAPSGHIYVGAGEDTTGGDLEPDGSEYMSGIYLKLEIGNYLVRFKREDNVIKLSFSLADRDFNKLDSPISL